MIKIGERIPQAVLYEFLDSQQEGCSLGPNAFNVEKIAKNKKIIIFGLPGAYTPTCSAEHLPAFVAQYTAFKNLGIDEIWCVSVNDAFVMGSWGREHKTANKVRMLGDGNAEFTKKLGLELDLSGHGMGLRSQRYAMSIEDGMIKFLWVETPGKFEVSSAKAVLAQLSLEVA